MNVKRAAWAVLVCAAIGLAVAANIAWEHHNLAADPGFVSWCNINSELSCNLVLSSEYARFLGVPVVYWAILTYLAMGIGALVVLQSASVTRRRQVSAALFAAAVIGTVFSAYLAAISFFVLHAVCVLCSMLYLVQLGLLVSASLLATAVRATARGKVDLHKRAQFVAAVCGGAALVLVGAVAWKAVVGETVLTPEEIKVQDPDFYDWYTKLPTTSAPVAGGHSKGHADAVVTVVEFSDFECGHCANAYRSLKQVLPRYQKDVQLSFHHFPLDPACNPAVKQSVHKYACLAAQAAECAGAQGRFWEYHDQLFEHQSHLDRDSLLEYAADIGLDRAAFLACLDSDAARQAIARDVAEAIRLGVESTPTFYLNGRTLAGAPRADRLGYAIQLERAAKQRGEG
jgi:protein-disulfide isomerase